MCIHVTQQELPLTDRRIPTFHLAFDDLDVPSNIGGNSLEDVMFGVPAPAPVPVCARGVHPRCEVQ